MPVNLPLFPGVRPLFAEPSALAGRAMLPGVVLDARATCYECFKPAALCVCARTPRVDNRTRIFILQHPRERFHPIGTVRFARLGLARVECELAFTERSGERAPFELPHGTGLLYPSRDARSLETLGESERPPALVVIDGTWHHARTMLRDERWLHALPRFRYTPAAPSRYRIRREPDPGFVSTIEAVAGALAALEPETPGVAGLLAAFESMIDDQLAFIRARGGRPRVLARRRPVRAIPRALTSGSPNLVVAYGESGGSRTRDSRHRDLVTWSAVRAHDGAHFEALVAPASPLDPHHLAMMGLDAAKLSRGRSLEAVRADWREFAGARPIVAAWNQSTIDLLASAELVAESTLLLKGVYTGLTRGACGALEDVVRRERLALPELPISGRARERLAGALAVTRWLESGGAAAIEPRTG